MMFSPQFINQFYEMIFHGNKKEQGIDSTCSFYISGGTGNCQPGIEIFNLDSVSLNV